MENWTHHDFLDVYVRNPRDRGMEAVGFREIKLGLKDLDQEHITYMNLLEESSRTCLFLEIFSAQKEEKRKRDFNGFWSLHVLEIDHKGARTLPLAWSSLECSKMGRMDEDPWEKSVCVLGVSWPRVRESEWEGLWVILEIVSRLWVQDLGLKYW